VLLEVRNLTKRFGGLTAVSDLSFGLEEGDIVGVFGPNGSGKTTLLNLISGVYLPTAGELIWKGRAFNGRKPHEIAEAGIVKTFQNPQLFGELSVFDNVAFGLKLAGEVRGSELAGRVESALKDAAIWDEIKDKLHADGRSLSGGQQQRVCIARTIAVQPEVLLLDEPTAALDPISTLKVEETLQALREKYCIVIVTHNLQQAARVSNVTGFMYMGELVEIGPSNEVFTAPKNRRTDDYITGRFG